MDSDNSQDDPLRLTPDEVSAETRDQKIRDVIRQMNCGKELPLDPLVGAIPVGELEYWASVGNISKVKLAIQNGADVNARSDNGYTALHAAALNGHLDVAKLLVLQGANVSAHSPQENL